jgi:hypothetical protein
VFVGGKEEAGFVNQIQTDDGKSFAVFSPLCNKVPVVDDKFFKAYARHHISGQYLIGYVYKNPFVVS